MQPEELQETDESKAREQETENMIRREESSGEKMWRSLKILISVNTHTHMYTLRSGVMSKLSTPIIASCH